MAQSDFHAVNAVNGRIASRGAPQYGDVGIGNETHMHQVILDGFRKVKRE